MDSLSSGYSADEIVDIIVEEVPATEVAEAGIICPPPPVVFPA